MRNEQPITDFIDDCHPGAAPDSVPFGVPIQRTNSLIADRIGNSDDRGSDITI
ncbi:MULTISPECIES: hypothetical protein [unclassified Mesorhizobium]|uniref:hypothetical protein n=1 Tax=unclassified Mesorhizobium TaxID=325217 RepID=UPI0015E43219|nr:MULTISPECIES: hypothetical protein [unclassified Mesorhizobium]